MVKTLTRSDRIFLTLNAAFLIVVALATIYPLYYILVASLTPPEIINTGDALLVPRGATLDGYRHIIRYRRIWTGYGNTIIYSVGGATLGTAVTLMYAYGIAQKKFSLRLPLTIFALITMFFSGGLIPTYLTVRGLGILGTRWPVIIVGLIGFWHIMITRTFLSTSIPSDLQEAAYMDGCGHLRYFVQVVIPLSRAIIVVLLLFYGVGQWNDFFRALIYLTDQSMYPLQLVLRDILASTEVTDATLELMQDIDSLLERQRLADQVKYGVIIVSALPLLVAYPFLQRFFVKGIMIGSVKG